MLIYRPYPLAQSLYIKHCRINSPGTLRDIYEQEDNHTAQAELCLRDYLDPSVIRFVLFFVDFISFFLE